MIWGSRVEPKKRTFKKSTKAQIIREKAFWDFSTKNYHKLTVAWKLPAKPSISCGCFCFDRKQRKLQNYFHVLLFILSWNYTMLDSINMQTHLEVSILLLVVSACVALDRSLSIRILIILAVCVVILARLMYWHWGFRRTAMIRDCLAMSWARLHSNLVSFPLKRRNKISLVSFECVDKTIREMQEPI